MARGQDIRRYRRNLQGEVDSAALYRAMAATEAKAELAELYGRLAAVEEAHAEFWRRRLREAGVTEAAEVVARPGWRTRVLIWAARRLGAEAVLPAIAGQETRDRAVYDSQRESRSTAMPHQERYHARLLSRLSGLRLGRAWDGGVYSRLEGRHGAGGGNALRAAVLGANDGLMSTLSLVMGVAGADFSPRAVLAAGVAGMLAGACSMAMGEWVSVQSARELYASQIAAESEELAEAPEEEQEELVLIYQAKGLPADEARRIAAQVMRDPGSALETLTREELGINPGDLGGSAWAAALASCLVFLVGAALPVLPLALLDGRAAIAASLVASALGLFLIGAAITLFTGRSALVSGLRQLAIGLAAAGITYGAGQLLGVAVGG